MKRLKAKWCVSWSYVDRLTLFGAVRGNAKWRDDVIGTEQIIDDHEPDTISASVYVETLDELRDLLNATKEVKSHWGSVLHCLSENDRDNEQVRLSATLAAEHSQFATDCGYSVRIPGNDDFSELDKQIRVAVDALAKIREQYAMRQAAGG